MAESAPDFRIPSGDPMRAAMKVLRRAIVRQGRISTPFRPAFASGDRRRLGGKDGFLADYGRHRVRDLCPNGVRRPMAGSRPQDPSPVPATPGDAASHPHP